LEVGRCIMAPFIISLEGNIGAGKSTVLNHLKNNLHAAGSRKIVYVDEPLQQWESITSKNGETMLELFYKDSTKYAFSFQMMAYISRLANLQEVVKKYPNHIIMMERSLMTDYHVFAKMLYESGNLLTEEYEIYKRWFNHFNTVHIDAIIYLRCEPEVSWERCKQRNRSGETISLDYMTKVHEKHETWINNNELRPLLVIDNETTEIDDVLFCIEDFLDDIVYPLDVDNFMERMYSSYAFTKMILYWFIFSVCMFLKKA
jgi:deoxyadenosine/deoxycytidine kinase